MYQAHFGLHRQLFQGGNPARTWLMSQSVRRLLPSVLHAVRSDLGFALVTGPAGAGKSAFLKYLQSRLTSELRVLPCSGSGLGDAAALRLVIQIGVSASAQEDVAGVAAVVWSRTQLLSQLRRAQEFWGPVLLLIDDAHLIPPAVLNELRSLSEEQEAGRSLIRAVLVAPLSFEEELGRTTHQEFSQRIRCHRFLEPLTSSESFEFLRRQFDDCGGCVSDILTSDAAEFIVAAAGGSPRCLCLLTDEVLLVAAEAGCKPADLSTAREALSHLRHLPYLWNQSPLQSDWPATSADLETHEVGHTSSTAVELGSPTEPQTSSTFTSESAATAPAPTSIVEFGAASAVEFGATPATASIAAAGDHPVVASITNAGPETLQIETDDPSVVGQALVATRLTARTEGVPTIQIEVPDDVALDITGDPGDEPVCGVFDIPVHQLLSTCSDREGDRERRTLIFDRYLMTSTHGCGNPGGTTATVVASPARTALHETWEELDGPGWMSQTTMTRGSASSRWRAVIPVNRLEDTNAAWPAHRVSLTPSAAHGEQLISVIEPEAPGAAVDVITRLVRQDLDGSQENGWFEIGQSAVAHESSEIETSPTTQTGRSAFDHWQDGTLLRAVTQVPDAGLPDDIAPVVEDSQVEETVAAGFVDVAPSATDDVRDTRNGVSDAPAAQHEPRSEQTERFYSLAAMVPLPGSPIRREALAPEDESLMASVAALQDELRQFHGETSFGSRDAEPASAPQSDHSVDNCRRDNLSAPADAGGEDSLLALAIRRVERLMPEPLAVTAIPDAAAVVHLERNSGNATTASNEAAAPDVTPGTTDVASTPGVNLRLNRLFTTLRAQRRSTRE